MHAAAGTKFTLTWTFADGTGILVSGMPMFVRLISPDGKSRTTIAVPRRSPPTSDPYRVIVAVPRGGIGKIEIGSTTNGATGFFLITNDPFKHK